MNSFPCNISIESWNGDRFLYKDNLGLCSARNMRASCRMSAPVMVIVMKEKFLCLISRVFCLVLRIENLFIRLTRRDNMPHITVISSFHLLLWIYQTFMLKQLPVMWQWRQKLSLSHPSLYRESLISTWCFFLACTVHHVVMSCHWAPCVTSSLRDHQERTEQWRLVRRTASKYCNCAAQSGAQCVEKRREGSSKPRLWSTLKYVNYFWISNMFSSGITMGFLQCHQNIFELLSEEERFLLKTCWSLENILWKWIIFVRWIWQCDTTPRSSVVYMRQRDNKN